MAHYQETDQAVLSFPVVVKVPPFKKDRKKGVVFTTIYFLHNLGMDPIS
jgi:hypothetical protein